MAADFKLFCASSPSPAASTPDIAEMIDYSKILLGRLVSGKPRLVSRQLAQRSQAAQTILPTALRL
jgi:hypothetical protein